MTISINVVGTHQVYIERPWKVEEPRYDWIGNTWA